MTLMETALAGAVVIASTMTVLALIERVSKRPGLLDLGWGPALFAAALAYLERGGVLPTSRHYLALGILGLWCIVYTRDAWLILRKADPSRKGPTLLGSIGRAFLASAPALLVLSEGLDDGWSWNEGFAVAVSVAGWVVVLLGRQPGQLGRRDWITYGYVAAFAGLYLLSFESTSGYLSLFALVIIGRQCRRSLVLPYVLSDTPAGPVVAELRHSGLW